MKETPIAYSPDMILARKAGRKTQTRRNVEPQPDWVNSLGVAFYPNGKGPVDYRLSPYGTAGDRLWVREEHRILECWVEGERSRALVEYRADLETRWCSLTEKDVKQLMARKTPFSTWMRARFMLRSFSRAMDEITQVRVERLLDISGTDAIAEGIESHSTDLGGGTVTTFRDYLTGATDRAARQSYQTLWESINGPGSWEANPFVWALTFKPVAQP
jgi:hypothetical protein